MIKSIPYRISKIETLQFAMFPNDYKNGEVVKVNTSIGFNLRSDIENVRNILKVEYFQDEKLLLVLELSCYYDILPEGSDAIKQEYKIPVDFLRYIGTITVGAARGVIHARTAGSVINPVVLPPINLNDMIIGDLVFDPKDIKNDE